MQDYRMQFFEHWIPIKKIQAFIQLETFIVLMVVGLLSWLFYRYFLKEISNRRHTRLRVQFRRGLIFWGLSAILSFLFWLIHEYQWQHPVLFKMGVYFALFSILVGAITVILLAQLLVYLLLFFQNMNVGVPRLIVNMFTLVFGIAVFTWVTREIFGLAVMPLLATSAVFSLVLGLALQDTLGNLFSGVALQLERPYNIGDWVEVYTGTYHWIGQIQEINWRATLLVSYSEELISIPNKTMAQSQIMLVPAGTRAPRRNQTFYIPHSADFIRVKDLIYQSSLATPGVLTDPEPVVLTVDNNPSWIVFKVFYSIDDFARQYRIGDQLFSNCIHELNRAGVPLAKPTLELVKTIS
jgi:small-conductance mechanosensitive channel